MIRLDPGAAELSVAEVRAGIESIGAILDGLESQVHLLQADWSGEARRAFTLAQRKWEVRIRELASIANQLTHSAQAASETLTNTERAAAKLWQ